jgi:hypothetical protein
VSQADLEGKNAEFTTPDGFMQRVVAVDKVVSV